MQFINFVCRAPLNHSAMNTRTRIYSAEGMNQIPLALSVDWLNDKLYILFESNSLVSFLVFFFFSKLLLNLNAGDLNIIYFECLEAK